VKTLKLLTGFGYFKKGRSFLLLPFFLFVTSCSVVNLSHYGRVTFHNGQQKNSFVFYVNDDFLKKNSNSKRDANNPKITEAESKLLLSLLKQKKSCLNKSQTPSFRIISRQEKIYDVTFAHLIESNYNAEPVAPRMYFGRCVADSF
jgi:hypothetical protein